MTLTETLKALLDIKLITKQEYQRAYDSVYASTGINYKENKKWHL